MSTTSNPVCPGPTPTTPDAPGFVPPDCCGCELCGGCYFDQDSTVNLIWNVNEASPCSPYPSGTQNNMLFVGKFGNLYKWGYYEYEEPTGEAGVSKIVEVAFNCDTGVWTAVVGRDTPINQVELYHFEQIPDCGALCYGAELDLVQDIHCTSFVPGSTGSASIVVNHTGNCSPVGCCTGSVTVTITGFANGVDGSADCANCGDFNDVIVVANTGDCLWEGNGVTISFQDGDWVLTYTSPLCGSGSMSWRAPWNNNCPPATGWKCFAADNNILDGCDVGTTSNPAVTIA